MSLLPTLAFWSSAMIVGYTYAGYPSIMLTWSRTPQWLRRRAPRRAAITPTLSVVMAARNEADRIGPKLDNLLSLDYPADKREIIVVSDGSTDGTDEVVRRYADRGVVLERVDEPSGKPTAINRGVARSTGELVVFCDARQDIDAHALRALAQPFADPEIGAVSGELQMPGDKGPGMYWRYEKAIRLAESQVDSVVGATGALYAIRRELFRELPHDCLLDDVYTPFQVMLSGHRVIMEPEARVFDVEASHAGEFARKARTLAGNFQLLGQVPQLLNPLRNRMLFQLVSHKLMRLVCPAALVTLAVSSATLVATAAPGWPLHAVALTAQLALYGLATTGAVRGDAGGRAARLCYTFVVLNAAAVEGFRRFVTGNLEWTTSKTPRTLTHPA